MVEVVRYTTVCTVNCKLVDFYILQQYSTIYIFIFKIAVHFSIQSISFRQFTVCLMSIPKEVRING